MSSTPIPIAIFFRDTRVKVFIGIALVLNATMWLVVYFRIPHKDTPLFLHHTIYFGVDWIGAWWKAYTFPLIGFIIGFGNSLLAWMFFRSRSFVSLMLLVVTVFIQAFLLIQTIVVVMLNT